MKFSRGIFWVFILAASTACVAKAQDSDVADSKDHPLITRYPGSIITEYRYSQFDEATLPLGKANDDGVPAKSQHLEGKITRIVYESPAHRSMLEVYRNYESALARAGFQTLFTCVNEEGCGSKGPEISTAAGHDDWEWSKGQRYIAAKAPKSTGDVYVALHVGQWSNPDKGPQVVLYVIEVKPMEGGLVTVNAAALASDITASGHSSVYGIYFDTGKADVKPESDAALNEIAKLLRQEPGLKLLVVGHTDNVGQLAANMDLSKRRADAVVNALTTRYGIAASRLIAQGVGPLAPVASNHTEAGRAQNRRVELVEQ